MPLFTPRDLVEALRQTHAQSLQTLHLDFLHYYNLHDPELRQEVASLHDNEYIYPSFRGFACLSRIRIEFEKLAKLSDLPESLDCLELGHCRSGDLDQMYLADLVRLREKWCPVIESVTIQGWETDGGIAAIQRYAESLDIRVRVSMNGHQLEVLGVGYRLVMQMRLAEDIS